MKKKNTGEPKCEGHEGRRAVISRGAARDVAGVLGRMSDVLTKRAEGLVGPASALKLSA